LEKRWDCGIAKEEFGGNIKHFDAHKKIINKQKTVLSGGYKGAAIRDI
jgi:hypothetical protein